MTTNENDRLDLRQAFEQVFADERIAVTTAVMLGGYITAVLG